MDNQKSNMPEQQLGLTGEMDHFMEAVNDNPNVVNAPLPSNLRENIFKEIRSREADRAIRAIDEELIKGGAALEEEEDLEEETDSKGGVSAEEKELIRLGKIYKKRRKVQRYLVLAAALVFVLAFGITSMGGPKKVFEMFDLFSTGRNQTQVNSNEGVEVVETVTEEEVYQQIEDEFGFAPVKSVYRPEGVTLLEVSMGDEIQGINMIYGQNDKVKMTYVIRPNYKTSSLGKDVEDDLIEEYVEETEHAIIYIRKYLVDNAEERWSVQFEYKEVSYSMLIMDSNEVEVKKIVKNLFFS